MSRLRTRQLHSDPPDEPGQGPVSAASLTRGAGICEDNRHLDLLMGRGLVQENHPRHRVRGANSSCTGWPMMAATVLPGKVVGALERWGFEIDHGPQVVRKRPPNRSDR